MPVFLLTVVLALTWLAVSVVLSAPCDLQSNGACKCTVAFCDTVEDIGPVGENDIIVYTSSKNGGARLNRTVASFTTSTSTKAAAEPSFKLVLDTAITAQSFFGVGGAFTDAAAVNFVALPDELQKHVLQAYYGPGGIGYSVGRIPIASTDFSTSMYSYDDQANDYNMTSFSIAMDFPSGKIPLIQQAASLAREEGKPLRLFGSSWSPPAWMKTTNSRIGGQMKGVAGDLYHKSYAKYLSLFVTEYGRQANLDLWGITVQNEPNTPELYTWDSCTFTAEEMRDFVKLDLGPRLRADHPQLQLMVLDGQRTYLPTYAETIMADEEAAQFVDGIGMHWYGSVNDLFNVAPKLNATFTEFPQLFGLATEACNGYLPLINGPRPGDWEYGENYSRDILVDFNNGVSGWTDWNILLDQKGGPNHANNVVDAPILAYPAAAAAEAYILKNPSFYHLGHFAKFMTSGDVRVRLDSTSSVPLVPAIESVAWVNPVSKLAHLVLLNRDFVSGRTFELIFGGKTYTGFIDRNAIQTLVIKYA